MNWKQATDGGRARCHLGYDEVTDHKDRRLRRRENRVMLSEAVKEEGVNSLTP